MLPPSHSLQQDDRQERIDHFDLFPRQWPPLHDTFFLPENMSISYRLSLFLSNSHGTDSGNTSLNSTKYLYKKIDFSGSHEDVYRRFERWQLRKPRIDLRGAIRSSVQAPTLDPLSTKTLDVPETSLEQNPSELWILIPLHSCSCYSATIARSSTIDSSVDLGLPCCRFRTTGFFFY